MMSLAGRFRCNVIGANEMDYRNYAIEHDATTGKYVARSVDDDFCLVSRDQSRVKKAIDQLWTALRYLDGDAMRLLDLEALALPGWIRSWLRSDANCVDIDKAFATGNL